MIRSGLTLLARDTAVYGVAGAGSRFLMLLALPIVAKNLSPDDFGVWTLLTIAGSFVATFVTFGIDSAVVRYYYDDDSHAHRQAIFSNGALFQGAASIAVVALLALGASLVLGMLHVESRYRAALWIVLATTPPMVLGQYAQNWFKWTFQRTRFLATTVGLAALTLGLLFYFIQVQSTGLYGVLVVTAAAQWVVAAVALWWCRDYVRWRPRRQLLSGLVRFGFPMMLVGLASVCLGALDRLFLTHYVDPAGLGIYAFGQRLSLIMVVVVTAFQSAFGPFSFSIWGQSQAPETFARFQTYYIAAAGAVALLICAFGKVLVQVLGSSQYVTAERVLPVLVFGSLVYGLYSFAALGVFYSKKSVLNLAALACGVSAAVVTNILLVPHMHGIGVALGFAVGNLVLVAVGYLISRRLYPVKFRLFADLGLLTVLALLLWGTGTTVSGSPWGDAIAKALLGVTLYLGAALVFGAPADRTWVLTRLRKVISTSP